jgi:glycosyltransferase involved in cell wall biosynthesis
MASVMRMLADNPDPRFVVSPVPTFKDTGAAVRLWTGVRGILLSTGLILLGRADVLHVHLAHGGSVMRKSLPLTVARLCGVPTIVHGHSFNFSGWFDRMPAPVQRLVRTTLRADRWLVLGESLAQEYRQRLGLQIDQIQVLYNPVAVPAPVTPGSPPPQQLTVLSLGRLGQRKGTYDLVRAVELLPVDVRERLHVILAGDGEVDHVRALVAARGLDDTIDVIGWIEPLERDELLRHADIFALPSYAEGLPMAILEAMAHGVVPLSTPVGGIPGAVTDGVDGILVPPGAPAQLADALRRLAIDDELRTQLSVAARYRAHAFDINGWRAELAQLWLSLAGRQS